MIEKCIELILNKVADPFLALLLLLSFVVIGALFFLYLKQDKTIVALRKCIDVSIAENNLTTRELVTLVSVLVYGRERDGYNKKNN